MYDTWMKKTNLSSVTIFSFFFDYPQKDIYIYIIVRVISLWDNQCIVDGFNLDFYLIYTTDDIMRKEEK